MVLDDLEHRLSARRRVVTFLWLWVNALGIHYFLDPAANAFVEVRVWKHQFFQRYRYH